MNILDLIANETGYTFRKETAHEYGGGYQPEADKYLDEQVSAQAHMVSRHPP